jgi:hypothetical protein
MVSFERLPGDIAKQFLGQFDHIAVVGIGAVQLTGGELGIMRLIDAFISKIFADLKHPGNTAYQQSLEEEFWCNAHEKRHFVVVVISNKRFLSYKRYTAMAPPQEGDRVGVYTSIYSLSYNSCLNEEIIFERSFTNLTASAFVMRSMCLLRYLIS